MEIEVPVSLFFYMDGICFSWDWDPNTGKGHAFFEPFWQWLQVSTLDFW